MSGIFITFEGSEGCGKSTQIARLAKYLSQKHPSREVVVLREPGGTALGERVRHLLQHAPETTNITPEAELLLFAASRAQLVREVIHPALARAAIVLCDRFFDSTIVYQGVARGMNLQKINTMNELAVGNCMPDATILLDLDTATGRQRMQRRNERSSSAIDRMEQEPESFYEAVRRGYLNLASQEPTRWIVIDASRSPEHVAQEIIRQLDKNLKKQAA